MDNVTFILIVLGLAAAAYVIAKAVGILGRRGLSGTLRSVSLLIVGLVLAFGKLFTGRESRATEVSSDGPGDAPGEEYRSTEAWDKVGAVSAPEQYLHHADSQISGLAQAHLDDD